MGQRASNRPFALVQDTSAGRDYWEIWDERMPFNAPNRSIVMVVHGFWYVESDAGDWRGPFRSREHARVSSAYKASG